jgi:hypothetical protein
MNPIEPILTTEEPRYDPERASRPRIKVLKTPYSDDPMAEGATFSIFGCVYICYAKKTRGRSMIRYLGIADVEHGRKLIDPAPASKVLKDAIDDDVMKDLVGERPREKEQTPFESGKLLDEATEALDSDAMGDAIREVIDDEIVQKAIKEVESHG